MVNDSLRTRPWHEAEMCHVGRVPCVYVGIWPDCRIMLPGHNQPWHKEKGFGYTVEQLRAIGYQVKPPLIKGGGI